MVQKVNNTCISTYLGGIDQMADNRNSCCSKSANNSVGNDPVYIDVNRILDSCRDKDCFEDVRVYLTEFGQEVIDRSGSVRTKCAKIIGSNISVTPLTFNRGFYQVNIRIFVKIVAESCLCGGKAQEIEGLAIVDKSVILFGSEGSVKIFKSSACEDNFCTLPDFNNECETNLPTAVLEIVDPVVLSTRIMEKCQCRCCCSCLCPEELPEKVCSCLNGPLCDNSNSGCVLTVTLGFFSVVRMERPGQFLINATEYCVPEKECVFAEDDDPCSAFKKMCFPTDQFCPPSLSNNSCGCR